MNKLLFIVAKGVLESLFQNMDSIAAECTEAKNKYEKCFNKWFSEKYLQKETAEPDCEDLFQNYLSCLQAYMKKHDFHKILEQKPK